MKNKLLSLLTLPIALSFVTGCNNPDAGKMKLTYGTYITTAENDFSNNDAVQITYEDLSFKMNKNSPYSNENFILVIAPTNGCVCWNSFQPVLKQFIRESHYNVYYLTVLDMENKDSFGLTYKQGYVSLAIIEGGKILSQYPSASTFETSKALKSEIDKYVIAPEMYLATPQYFNDAVKNGENMFVSFIRNGCGDCSYMIPRVLWPYANTHKFKYKMYVVDLQEMWEEAQEIPEDQKSDYQEFKDNFNLSTLRSKAYGYDNGYVPTTQYYEDGVIKGASVYFNDTVSVVDGEYVVTNTFYSVARQSYLPYTKNVKTRILEGLKIKETDVAIYGEYIAWKQDAANTYHQPLFEAFMDYYNAEKLA